jgi:hypothetical protein
MTSSPARKKLPPKKAKGKADEAGFTCEFCSKTYVHEKTFLTHLCEQKRRFMDRDLPHVMLALRVYQRFWEANYRGQHKRTYEQFSKSQFYVAIVKFARYLQNLNAVNPHGFIDFLIKTGVKLDNWHHPTVYETYIRELNKKESPDAAVTRNIMLMQEWSLTTNEEWIDFFRKINTNQAVLWIQTGRISPWILYAASSAGELLSRLSPEQISIVNKHVNHDFWAARIKYNQDDFNSIRNILDEAGV